MFVRCDERPEQKARKKDATLALFQSVLCTVDWTCGSGHGVRQSTVAGLCTEPRKQKKERACLMGQFSRCPMSTTCRKVLPMATTDLPASFVAPRGNIPRNTWGWDFPSVLSLSQFSQVDNQNLLS